MNKLNAVLLVLALFLTFSMYGQTYKSGGQYNLQVKSTGQYLDVAGSSSSNNASIVAYQKTGNKNQLFQLWVGADGYCSFNPTHNTGKRLAESTYAQPGMIIQYDKQDKSNFHFKPTSRGNGYYTIQSKMNVEKGGNKVWTIIDGKLNTAAYQAGNANQLFKFVDTNAPVVDKTLRPDLDNEGYYFIQVKAGGKHVDVPGSSTSNGADILVWNKTYNDNQLFKVWIDKKTDYCSFNPSNSTGLRLDQSVAKNGVIHQYTRAADTDAYGLKNQHFRLTKRTGDYYTVQSRRNVEEGANKVWTVKNGKLVTDTYRVGDDNQLFKFNGYSKKNWMGIIKDNVNLKDLTIAGAHDAGANFGCSGVYAHFSAYALCQDVSITSQLNSGVRYLDIRLNYNDDEGTMGIYHGKCFQNNYFVNILTEVSNFLAANPSEAVLMRIKDEDEDDDEASKSAFARNLDEYFDRDSTLFYQGSDIPNLDQARGKIVVIDYSNKFDKFHPHSSLDAPSGSLSVISADGPTTKEYRWENTLNRMMLCNRQTIRSNLWLNPFNGNGLLVRMPKVEDLDINTAYENIAREFFHGAQGVLTTVDTPRDVANFMLPKLQYELDKPANRRGRFGVVAMDFQTDAVVDQLVRANLMVGNVKD